MNDFVNTHLQQRKSSLASLTKNSSRPSLKMPSDHKNYPLDNHKDPSSSNIYNHQQVPAQKPPSKINQTIQSIDSSLAKSRGKIQQQQNGDYIRNLYKKYLGKQNKQSSERINAYTERKLRTTESRQILTNNTGVKDFTKRALFKDNQNELLNPNDRKIIKSRELALGYQELEIHDQGMKSQIASQSRGSLKTKKQLVKKNEKEIASEKQKTETKKYKSRQKVEKSHNDKENKADTFQRSESTRQKWPQSRSSQNQVDKRKLMTQVFVSIKHQQKVKIKQKVMQGVVHPHRESYCQFDTEQQTTNSKMSLPRNDSRQIRMVKDLSCQRTDLSCHKTEHEQTQNLIVDSKVVNCWKEGSSYRMQELELFLGEQNSLLRALKRIHKVKQMSARNQRGSSSLKERKIFVY